MNKEQEQLSYQVEQLQKIIEGIDSQLIEVQIIKESLEDFKKLKGDEEILFPIANGIFASGKLSDNKVLKMNVGNNVITDKTVDQTIELMTVQYNDITNYKNQLIKQLELLLNNMS